MKHLVMPTLALMLFGGAAMAQTAAPPPPPPADESAMPNGPPPGPDADEAGPRGPKGPPGGPGLRRPPPPSKAAHFRLRRGDMEVDAKCADDEPTKGCVDAVILLMDRMGAQKP